MKIINTINRLGGTSSDGIINHRGLSAANRYGASRSWGISGVISYGGNVRFGFGYSICRTVPCLSTFGSLDSVISDRGTR